MKSAPLLLTICLFATSCREDGSSAEKSTPPATGETLAKGETPDSDAAFAGLTQEDGEALAKQRKLIPRVVMVDGQPRPATRDYRPDRVNFEIEQGRIVRTSRG